MMGTRFASRRALPITAGLLVVLNACAGAVESAPEASVSATAAASGASDMLAAGSFQADFGTVTLDATGRGSDVSGEMEIENDEVGFSVGLECSQTTDDGLLVVGGEVTDSTHDEVSIDSRAALILDAGEPVRAILWLEDPPPADSCPAFLASIPDDAATYLMPVSGDVEFGP